MLLAPLVLYIIVVLDWRLVLTTRNSSHNISLFRDQCIAKYFWNDVEVQKWIYDIQLSLYLSTDVISCVLDSTFKLNRSEMSVSFLVVIIMFLI